ncbi:MAG: EAL domain-containing protein [Acidimicrobiales bacterium]
MGNQPRAVAERGGSTASFVALGIGSLWVGLHAAGALGSHASLTFVLLAAASIVATLVGIAWWRPRPAWPWLLTLAAFVLFLVGGAARQALGTLGDMSSTRSAWPDLVTLPGYLLVAIGLAYAARAGRRGRVGGVDAALDAALAALAALALAWAYLIEPTLSQQADLRVRFILLCYPTLSVFLVAIGVQLAFTSGAWRSTAFRLVMAALVCLLVGDVVYMLVDSRLVASPGNLLDVAYALAFVLFIAAVLHPSMRGLTVAIPSVKTEGQPGRLVLVVVAISVPAVLTLTAAASNLQDRVVLATIVLALAATAGWRMMRALREHADSATRLAHQATHDALTGLPNRVYLHQYLTEELVRSASSHRRERAGDEDRHEPSVALLFLDLDRFKLVNDTMGHTTGDDLLIAVAERLRDNMRPSDLVGRIGGDEFLIVVSGARDSAHALEIAERARVAFMAPFSVRGLDIQISVSVGVTLYERYAGVDAEVMLRNADTAMYQAKALGGNAVAAFDASMRERVARRLLLENEMHQALERGEFHLCYQPIVRLGLDRVAGLEALLRWSHPTLGEIGPDVFVPIAEDTGLIVELGDWVIDQACAALARLHTEIGDGHELTMSVNLSARQLRDDRVIDHIGRTLARHHLSPSSLCVELTESSVMENMNLISEMLATLRSCGVRVAIDDFGTGYSSLAYLKQLPIDEVKIDRSFVHGLDEDGPNSSLVGAVVTIARSLGITTVAEGVETTHQVERALELGCQEAQGYLFSRPVAEDVLPAVLERLGLATDPHLRVVRDLA